MGHPVNWAKTEFPEVVQLSGFHCMTPLKESNSMCDNQGLLNLTNYCEETHFYGMPPCENDSLACLSQSWFYAGCLLIIC